MSYDSLLQRPDSVCRDILFSLDAISFPHLISASGRPNAAMNINESESAHHKATVHNSPLFLRQVGGCTVTVLVNLFKVRGLKLKDSEQLNMMYHLRHLATLNELSKRLVQQQ